MNGCDYAAALSSHYQIGAPAGWEEDFITAYAASHPWEDWAETWAHYLQILDGLETCEGLGIEVQRIALPLVQFPAEAGALPRHAAAVRRRRTGVSRLAAAVDRACPPRSMKSPPAWASRRFIRS